MTKKIDDICNNVPVIPALSLNNLTDSICIAKALINGGLNVLEVTLRTDYGLQAIRELKHAFPEAIIGAGTVTTSAQFESAVEVGADFILSPGHTRELLKLASESNTPTIPGISTPSEAMLAIEFGFNRLKLFPAEALGGVNFLRALNGPFPQLKFCPTGGITINNVSQYLSLSNVFCVGGTWLTPNKLIELKKWKGIELLAVEAASLLEK
ncbi:MAG: bifunctional 4-hydroxy-2-oxoglutarate aldolase/2-dehydro-3-deoxy-phosphogluconate aldolase [Gammaproteobacteria bacterium]|jgi:2-dehydro-3-deoxyphosphogluconate aldolase/(4S)-4-hydroxy-2-oxoglutarate aldolase|nr:bifunctional 4-hydroxy-2-oxoglutarate aldolase/2-dehydro-3-deoxy-phosphogluconate aldolase [Gammaproteobacteria bacterium]